ncbi:MAG: hypothetical protein NW214_00465 [Pseudanabaenaceae cyanobacterium bins.39]|nr:hypothetical protein [Pseudanabaenaceae cyanobacterium bins.39]
MPILDSDSSPVPVATHTVTVEIPQPLYDKLLIKVNRENLKIDSLVIQGLDYVLSDCQDDHEYPDRWMLLKIELEQQMKTYVEQLLSDRGILAPAYANAHTKPNPQSESQEQSMQRDLPTPTIRPLQVGDRVLILDPDSPYYMAKLLVIRTSLIRATVETETGEHTLLKRDLRFVE